MAFFRADCQLHENPKKVYYVFVRHLPEFTLNKLLDGKRTGSHRTSGRPGPGRGVFRLTT